MNADDGREPAAHLQAEPQEARGAPGSRDTGSDGPSGGPADRPTGGSSETSDSTVDPQGARHGDAPQMPTGDQAG